MNLTRRNTIKAGAGVVAAVAIPALPVLAEENPDAELLALKRQLIRSIDAFNVSGDIPDEQGDRWDDCNADLENRIATAPAHSPSGVGVKLRRMQYFDGDWTTWTEDLIENSIAGLERLA